MSALVRILDPLRRAAAAFFLHDLALKREAGGVRLVLAERGAGGAHPEAVSLAQAAAQKEQRELALIQAQLAELLDGLPGTRHTIRHLVFVEQALGRQGLQALHRLPLDVLHTALAQIESMVTNWSPAGLASLRSKMAVAIIERGHMDPGEGADAAGTGTGTVPDDDADVAGLREAAAADAEQPLSSDAAALAAAYAGLGADLGARASPSALHL